LNKKKKKRKKRKMLLKCKTCGTEVECTAPPTTCTEADLPEDKGKSDDPRNKKDAHEGFHLDHVGAVASKVLLIGGVVVALPCLVAGAIGFGSAGIVAGSVAAASQSAMIGNVAAGSLFAIAQSLGATGIFVNGAVAGAAATGAGVAANLWRGKRDAEDDKNQQKHHEDADDSSDEKKDSGRGDKEDGDAIMSNKLSSTPKDGNENKGNNEEEDEGMWKRCTQCGNPVWRGVLQ
jgi:hypothetical protein